MAENKEIRISLTADASGLNRVAKTALKDLESSFKDLNLKSVFDDVNKSADSTSEKIQKLTAALRQAGDQKQKAFSGTGNEAFQTRQEKSRTDFEAKYGKATGALKEFERVTTESETARLKKASEAGVAGAGGTKLAGVNVRSGALDVNVVNGDRGGKAMGSTGKPALSNQRVDAGGGAGLLSRMYARGTTGGLQGAAMEGIHGEGGLADSASAGMGAGAGLIAGATAAALVMLISKAASNGMEQLRIENRSTALLGSRGFANSYDENSMNMSYTEFTKYGTETARGRKTGEDLGRETARRAQITNAYGLSNQDVSQFDQFRIMGGKSAASDATTIIADILKRSETNGILGADGKDFSRLPMVLSQISGIMSMQRSSGEKVNEGFAISMSEAGHNIGGRFGDERLGESMGRMNSSIQNPSNGGMKAYIFEMLKRANPNASLTDILGMQENGADGDNLKAILPQIAGMKQGEGRRMVLYQLTKNWQDANRLDKAGNLEEMYKAATKGGKVTATDDQFNKIKEKSTEVTTAVDALMHTMGTAWDKATESMAKDFNDAISGVHKEGDHNFAKMAGTVLAPFAFDAYAWNKIVKAIKH